MIPAPRYVGEGTFEGDIGLYRDITGLYRVLGLGFPKIRVTLFWGYL